MIKFLTIGALQSLFLALGQVFLKLGMMRLGKFEWTWSFMKSVLIDWPLAACGVTFGLAAVLWIKMLRDFDFSIAYPITSISYIFGMVAAAFVFNEAIPATRWIGVCFIMLGVFFVVK